MKEYRDMLKVEFRDILRNFLSENRE
ncbi:hypothetical protein CKA15_087 [Listeria phage cka15]|nr:hypothetical protein CKA15_087 [Listeria phage cka15]